MSFFKVESLGIRFGGVVAVDNVSFEVKRGECYTIIGPNGAGKTTIFRMIMGEEAPDEGDVTVPKKLTIGYFRQDVEEMSGRSVLDEAIAGSGRAGDLHHELGLTVVMVTHDLDTLFEISTTVAVLADQRVLINAPVREVIAVPHPFIKKFFLGERAQRAIEVIREYPFVV